MLFQTSNGSFDLPVDATVDGKCNVTDQYIEFTFHSNWTLKFVFKKDGDKVYGSDIYLKYDMDPKIFTEVSTDEENEPSRFTLDNAIK